MRRVRPLLPLVLAASLAVPLAIAVGDSDARADAGMMACTGPGGMQANIGVTIGGAGGQQVATASLANLLGQAECQCDSSDLYAQIHVTMALDKTKQTDALEVWVGTSCNTVMNRTGSSPTCERVATTATSMSFVTGGQGSGSDVFLRIPVRALISPLQHSCGAGTTSNSLWLLIFSDPNNPDDVCQLPLTAQTVPPATPTGVTAGSGDSAVTLSWASPSNVTNPPAHYQILCADASGQPLSGKGKTQGYSTCLPGGVVKRRPVSGGTTAGSGDGGTASPVDMMMLPPPGGGGVVDEPGGDPQPQADPSDGGVADAGLTDGGASGDGGATGPTTGPAPFTNLDPKFICSDVLDPTATQQRIDGLKNEASYSFLLVGIDGYGNAAPSTVVTATPHAVDDFYRRFRESGGKPQGFCFIATAAYGSYESPAVQLLRRFRDEALLPNAPGRAFVTWYYRVSPPAAAFIARHDIVRALVRVALWPVIALAAAWLWLGGAPTLAGLGALAGLLLAWRRRRRRRERDARGRRKPAMVAGAALGVLVLVACWASDARAGNEPPTLDHPGGDPLERSSAEDFAPETSPDYHSPQRFAFELKFGPYSPDIDASPGLDGRTPFLDLYTNQFDPHRGSRPPGKLLTTIEFDWQVWHGFGSLGLATAVGIQRRSTHAFQYPDNTLGHPCTVPDCTRSSDETTLTVMPFTLELVYRFDVMALRYKVPLVPYLKGGIGYYLWWNENGGGGISTAFKDGTTMLDDGDKGRGGTFGLVAHPGIALLLDVLDPGAAQTMDAELGINHSYLFFEMHYAWVTGLGSSTKMVLSDLTWNAGVAFEF